MRIPQSLTLLAASMAISACATSGRGAGLAGGEPGPVTTYYSGTIQVTSPDGSSSYGPSKPGLVARTVDREKGLIVEVVLDKGALRSTTLARVGESNEFQAQDTDKTFTGTLTFSGAPWSWTGWSYALSMTDGSGKIEGTALITDRSLRTEKFFLTPDGQRRARIVDDLQVIPKDEYERKLAELAKK